MLNPLPLLAASPPEAHHDPVAQLLLGLAAILLVAKLGGEIFERFRQPAVLGELLAGALMGNLDYLTGVGLFSGMRTDPFIDIFARIGVVLLLFEVGFETHVADMIKTGLSSFLVALFGVIAPTALGFLVGEWLLPGASATTHLFLGATLSATSVGITARVLKDMGRLKDREAQIILGAAVIDDVMGLILLAVVSGIVTSGSITLGDTARIVALSVLFLGGTLAIGGRIVTVASGYLSRMRVRGMQLITALAFCFGMAWVADLIGLAPIVGAFAAGLVVREEMFESFRGGRSVRDLLDPVATLFMPVFFVVMGMQMRFETFTDPKVLMLAGGITAAALLGKQVCSLGAVERGLDRLSIGIGMIPRGEVGLIFASIGRGLGVVDDALFSAIVVMVIVTTFITPVALNISMTSFTRRRKRPAA